jgi:hypothetical protein
MTSITATDRKRNHAAVLGVAGAGIGDRAERRALLPGLGRQVGAMGVASVASAERGPHGRPASRGVVTRCPFRDGSFSPWAEENARRPDGRWQSAPSWFRRFRGSAQHRRRHRPQPCACTTDPPGHFIHEMFRSREFGSLFPKIISFMRSPEGGSGACTGLWAVGSAAPLNHGTRGSSYLLIATVHRPGLGRQRPRCPWEPRWR